MHAPASRSEAHTQHAPILLKLQQLGRIACASSFATSLSSTSEHRKSPGVVLRKVGPGRVAPWRACASGQGY